MYTPSFTKPLLSSERLLFSSSSNVALRLQRPMTISKDYKNNLCYQGRRLIVQELCESRGGRPGLSVLTSLLASVDVKNH